MTSMTWIRRQWNHLRQQHTVADCWCIPRRWRRAGAGLNDDR